MGCKACTNNNPTILDDEKKEKLNETNDELRSETNSLGINDKSINEGIKRDNKNLEDNEEYYYFSRPKENTYSDEELLNMNILEVSLGIHMTKIFGKKSNKGNISFHPFFYVKLKNPKKIGVIVQYLKVPEKFNYLTHLWEEDGVEYLEKSYKDFELEYLQFIRRSSQQDLIIDDWLIKYDNIDLGQINLRKFFYKIIPNRGEWLQKKLNPFKHGCIHFCIQAIKNLGVKKEIEEIKLVKERMEKVLDLTRGQKYYQKYKEGFNALFDAIEEKN